MDIRTYYIRHVVIVKSFASLHLHSQILSHGLMGTKVSIESTLQNLAGSHPCTYTVDSDIHFLFRTYYIVGKYAVSNAANHLKTLFEHLSQ